MCGPLTAELGDIPAISQLADGGEVGVDHGANV
jgi:hypothetical protein